ncbi:MULTISPECIES: chlorinating enzyme [Pseudoalteromonas]|uniref:Chemotaxis protein CheX n=1 Tax=Pseudoalteromonas rubra TaxID=43658 RepID=A0A0L0EMH0_9GAMM|nr:MULTISPECIES: chlorinating enzyme [Pseudoalteromonas]ALU41748.1 chemotaxis protein CheX [Pseudoalteromonas rubra]KNC65639.1 chemotaxis protein CheX [Pseudoalteromonas rubra]MDK1313528.1 chlorinating enzyme [Pseudoalteromonas sp. R96]
MSFYLTEEEIQQMRTNGYIGPFDLYERDEILEKYKNIRAKMFDRKNAAYDLEHTSVVSGYDRHLDIDALSEHVMNPIIVNKVNSILGPDLICWRSEMFPKYPGDEGTDWHQADTFSHASGAPQIRWPGESDFGGAITVWTALTDVSEEVGCLCFIPGTHEEMYYDESKDMEYTPDEVNALEKDGVKRGFFGYDYRNLQKDPSWKPDESQAVPIKMKAGQFVIFWSTLMHSSLPNITKDQTRLGFAARYVPAAVDIYPDTDSVTEYGSELSLEKYGVVSVSGERNDSHNRVLDESLNGFSFKR